MLLYLLLRVAYILVLVSKRSKISQTLIRGRSHNIDALMDLIIEYNHGIRYSSIIHLLHVSQMKETQQDKMTIQKIKRITLNESKKRLSAHRSGYVFIEIMFYWK